MRSSRSNRLRRWALWLTLEFLLLSSVTAYTVWADSSTRSRSSVSSCYCGCHLSKTSAGCTKMCELPKYASRWWATSCAKPHATTPAENPGAGPHMVHPAKAERASN
jgi:hypothetical protein